MGRANPALQVWVFYPWITRKEVAELHDAGHHITGIGSDGGLCAITDGARPQQQAPDLILHPAAHAWNDEMWPYLDTALKAARKRRKETKV